MMKNTAAGENSLYSALKLRQTAEAAAAAEGGAREMALGDTERVKILSPGRLVTKRFLRNRLALVGLAILIVMFAFSFLGPLFYPYSQTQIFYTYGGLNIKYASAVRRTENVSYKIAGGAEVRSTVANRFNSYISELESEGLTEKTVIGTDENEYGIAKLGDKVYTLSAAMRTRTAVYMQSADVASYDNFIKEFQWTGEPLGEDFQSAALAAIENGDAGLTFGGADYVLTRARNQTVIRRANPLMEYDNADLGAEFVTAVEGALDGEAFEFAGKTYEAVETGAGSYSVYEIGDVTPALIASAYVFNSVEPGYAFSDEFRVNALFALYGGGSFDAGGASYTIAQTEDGPVILDAAGNSFAELSEFSIRRYSGQDTLPLDFKLTAQNVMEDMNARNLQTSEYVYALPAMDGEANYVRGENGELQYADTEISVERMPTGEFVFTCEQITHLIDVSAPPSESHAFGTDSNGMDILSRMMYGGRISLMVGFVVVFLEIILGVIFGGLAGFFSGWADTLIMRIVDIFYCIPSYPILIILGALLDQLKMDPYKRLIWMMATLGFLGWASVARLVRGQILSLREQEFMTAQEATGMRAMRRIFRHLIPNVMPQLIVVATMGVGSVIIYESTLSFLGLGVKHPLATWGTMINSVTASSEMIIRYAYIWVPVGLLICLTVIAFNFVGDGLRDAFDPKMKR